MSKFLNWKNAPATSNIAIFVPGVPNGGLVFAIEDEQGNVTSCKDGSIFSNFTVAGRRPPVGDNTTIGFRWLDREYEQLGLIIVKGDKILRYGEIESFAWRHHETDQPRDDYQGAVELDDSGYWRPLVMQNPRLPVVTETPAQPGTDDTDYRNAHVSKYVELGLVIENTDEVDENGIVSEFSWRKHGVDQFYVTYKGAIEVKDEYWRPRIIHELKNDEREILGFDLAKGDDMSVKVSEFISCKLLSQEAKEALANRFNIKIKNSGVYDKHPITTSVDILNQAVKEQGDRAATYDTPSGERSMGKTVAMFNILTGFNVTEEQGWQFMELLKMVRSSQGNFKMDNYVDGSGYASLAGESALRDRGDKS